MFAESDYAEIPEEIEANRSGIGTNESIMQIPKVDATSSDIELKVKKLDPELAIKTYLNEKGKM